MGIQQNFSIILAGVLMVGVSLFIGCSKPASEQADIMTYPYTIMTTTGMVNDIVKQVAGDKAVVKNIIGEGIDPHLYKPTRNDIVALQKGDVVFYSGLMLEGKMADALAKVATSGKPVYAVTERISCCPGISPTLRRLDVVRDESFLLSLEDFAGQFDPHVWMDVQGWMRAVDAIAVALSEFDPASDSIYAQNAAAYLATLVELDDYIDKSVETVPSESRVLITAHDAFNYFGRAYGVEVKGIQGISTESEAGLKKINELVDFIVDRKVKAVFVESSVSSKNVTALVEGAAKRGMEVKIGGVLFSDAMGAPGTYEGTYMGMLDHNATTITRGLGGDAPEKGLHGKLSGILQH
jgi:manganese/zinc/iron transport system substrate-binding protein